METENNIELMNRLNSSSMYLQSNDMKVTEVREGYAKVEMIIDEQILNVHGFVHGGALFSLADTVAGAASFSSGRDSVTLTGTINYIKPGKGGKLIGIAQEISRGRTTGVYEVFIFNDRNTLFISCNLYDVLFGFRPNQSKKSTGTCPKIDDATSG
ncbi:PaaI family thioesterase [Faecalicoccus pleomorphus]|uniref:PaaI family thioesterase n=1 Tax=Faecalicoccus pleomorphus TaxID=1323 RepID=UPI003F7AD2C3